MAKHPDIYTRNIVRTAVAIFVIYIITLFYSYKTVPLNWAIWLLFVLSFVFVSLIIMYFLKYHEVKKSNINPIKNTIRDLKELKREFEKTEDKKIAAEMEVCWKKLVGQMTRFLEPKHQYIWVMTNHYHGPIGKVEIHDNTNHIYFSAAKDVYLIHSPEITLDLSTIEYVEGIADLRGFYQKHGRKRPGKHWIKRLWEML